MNNISFKSRIRPVGNWEFQGLTSGFAKKQYVNYPWTVKESVLSEKAITKNVYDCTWIKSFQHGKTHKNLKVNDKRN